MSTENLKEILHYSTFSEEKLSLESLYAILAELDKREPDDSQITPEEAWVEFQSEYSDNESAYSACAFDEGVQTNKHSKNATTQTRTISVSVEQRKPRRLIYLKRVALIAAAFIIISTVFINTTAYGATVWQSIALWGRETFGFTETVVPNQLDERLQSLHDALTEHGVTELLVPTWIPEGFELIDLYVEELPGQTVFVSLFEDCEKALVVEIISSSFQTSSYYEKSGGDVTVYRRNGIEHHIILNMERIVVAWQNKNYEGSISGDITSGEAEKIIDSIYERK